MGHAIGGVPGRMNRYGDDQMCGDQNGQDTMTRPEGEGNMSTCFVWCLNPMEEVQSFRQDKDARGRHGNARLAALTGEYIAKLHSPSNENIFP